MWALRLARSMRSTLADPSRAGRATSGVAVAPRRQSCDQRRPVCAMANIGEAATDKRPVLLFDVMDTIVKDPFFQEMPKFFDMSFKELLAAKHPTAWVEFENGDIGQDELFHKFFSDGRKFDGEALIRMMVASYRYLDGMEELLVRLKAAGYEVHAMSNYPSWYLNIEEKLGLSRHLDWTFVSCKGPMKGLRKPAREAYDVAVASLNVAPSQVIFVDDRQVNVDAAHEAGIDALLFKDAEQLEAQLRERGLQF